MCDCKSLVTNAGYNCLIVLGPTAVGKTALAVRLADAFCGAVLSADSRQVYKGLDIGSGKDIDEYTLKNSDGTEKQIPYYLIDITDLSYEYSVYDYQQDFYKTFPIVQKKNLFPVICGGTGMYLDAIVRGYNLKRVPMNAALRLSLNGKTDKELVEILLKEKPEQHNKTDLEERHRIIRAIEIAVYEKSCASSGQQNCQVESVEKSYPRPDIRPFIIGTTFPRNIIRKKVRSRLSSRLDEGMIDEVSRLHSNGASWERLERLGLEYRFVSEFLQGKIKTYEELTESLAIAIGQFVKRQETWFRGMEKKGVKINWLPIESENRFSEALKIISRL